jgi:hypothetical protein
MPFIANAFILAKKNLFVDYCFHYCLTLTV